MVLLVCVVALSILAFRPIVHQPLALDETEEFSIGWQINNIGAKTFRPGGQEITHPLLYSYSHALVQRIFGDREFPLRMYGVFHYGLCLGLLILIIRSLVPARTGLQGPTGLIAAILYLLNPLLVQHSVVINADNNILTTAILIFIYFFIRGEQRPPEDKGYLWSRLFLGLLLAVCFWAKEVTPALVAIGVLLYRVLSPRRKTFVLDFFCILVFGFLVFWLSWWLYCAVNGIDVLAFVKSTIIGKGRLAIIQFSQKNTSRWILKTFYWPTYWVGAPFFIALVIIFVRRIITFFKTKAVAPLDLIFIVGLCIWWPFQFIKPNVDMMKYQYPAYPLFIIVISFYVARVLGKEALIGNKYKHALATVILLSAAAFYYYLLGDYILRLGYFAVKKIDVLFLIRYYTPILVVAATALAFFRHRGLAWKRGLLSIIFFIIPINAGLLLNQARADYTTVEVYLNYGESGLRETVEFLARRVRDGSVIAVRNDIIFYLRHRHGIRVKSNYDPKRFPMDVELDERLADFLTKAPIEYMVFDKVSTVSLRGKAMAQAVKDNYILLKKIGTFYIFKKERFLLNG